MADIQYIIKHVLHQGLRTYKFKNSKLKPIQQEKDCSKKGAVFAYRDKKNMTHGRGLVLTSEEGLAENKDNFTHWTPNVYCYGTYVDEFKTITKGHSENNLRQINTFYIDFDSQAGQAFEYNDILLEAIDLGFMPTMILKTDKGYQAYFVLAKPVYITAKSEFKSVKVAKMISDNLRQYFYNAGLPVDLTCNHFGIARIPRTDNVVFFEENYMYSFDTWITWSMKRADDKGKKKANLTVIAGSKGKRQVDEPWFDLLLHSDKIKGEKGIKGRNNVIFTLALAYYSSGYSIETCEYNLFEFNNRLDTPLEEKELLKITKSAYSGVYEAAHRDYIKILCKAWVSEELTNKDLFVSQGWTKFKKPREQRKRSHLREWKEDLLAYISEKSYTYKPYIVTTKKEIRETLGIPERSFDKLLIQLKKGNDVFYKVKRGKGGGIRIASVKTLCVSLIKLKKEEKEAYFNALSKVFGLTGSVVEKLLTHLLEEQTDLIQGHLFEIDTG